MKALLAALALCIVSTAEAESMSEKYHAERFASKCMQPPEPLPRHEYVTPEPPSRLGRREQMYAAFESERFATWQQECVAILVAWKANAAIERESVRREKELDETISSIKRTAHRAQACRNRVRLAIGMTDAQVKASCLGLPQSINRDTYAHAVIEQWVYEGDKTWYLYFTNGVLSGIQQ